MDIVKPDQIEERSMQIIHNEMDKNLISNFTKEELKVVKRCIHTSADFDYQYNLKFTNNVMDRALGGCFNNAIIVTDTMMAYSGINKKKLAELNCDIFCFMSDEDIIEKAKKEGVTRATKSMQKAFELHKTNKEKKIIIVVGNAPTALIELRNLYDEYEFRPDILIASPVGFVNVIESKQLILETNIPSIIAMGRKGGSNIAAAIINAIIYQL